MRYKIAIFFVLLSGLLLCSCGRNSAGIMDDSYHAGTDFQFFQIANSSGVWPKLQETENGCVFIHDDFVYTYDQRSGIIMPLCSRLNCLHDKEIDPEKRESCNAYLDHNSGISSFISLMLYKNHIYIAYQRNDTTPETPLLSVLYRIALDGTAKDEIFRSATIDSPIIHRGYMYYITQAYEVKEGQTVSAISSTLGLHRINVDGSKVVDETIMASDEYTGCQPIRAFGNHLYYSFVINNSYEEMYEYDINKGEFEEIDMHRAYTFCYGKLYSAEYDLDENVSDGQIYASNFKYQEHQIVSEDFQKLNYLVSDLQYLYENNGFFVFRDPETEIWFKAYDESMTLIDVFTLPETMKNVLYFPMEPAIGGEKYQYLVFEEAHESEETGTKEVSEWGLYVWDKSSIGTLHGKPYEQTKIVYDQDIAAASSQEDSYSYGSEEEITDEYEANLSEWTEEETAYNSEDYLCELNLSDTVVTAEFDIEEMSEKKLELYAWYIQGDSVRVRHLSSKGSGTEPYRAVMTLPEGAECFIGAKAMYSVTTIRISVDEAGREEKAEEEFSGIAYTGRIKKR